MNRAALPQSPTLLAAVMAVPVVLLGVSDAYTLLTPRHLQDDVQPYAALFVGLMLPCLYAAAHLLVRGRLHPFAMQLLGILAGHLCATVSVVTIYGLKGQLGQLAEAIRQFGPQTLAIPLLVAPLLFSGFAAGWLSVSLGQVLRWWLTDRPERAA